ncbi:MAG: hypothetical protein ACOC53_01800 [Candidatus Saliniplasma sp.]
MVEGKRGRIFLSIVLIFAVPIFILAIRALDVLLSIMTLLFMILMYYTNEIEPEPYREMDLKKLKIDIFLWSLLPMIFGAFGAARIIDLHFYFVFRDIAFTALTSIFAFTIMLNMDSHTDFRPNRFFTVSFIVVSTIGVGTIFGMIRFVSDRYLDTGYLGGNTHLMVYLLIVVLAGVIIGINFRDYIISYEFFPSTNLGSDFRTVDDFSNHRKEFLKVLNSLFRRYDDKYSMFVSRILQIAIFVIVVYGFMIGRWVIFSWAVFSLIFAVSPDLFKINTGDRAPSLLYLWIALVTFIYAFGRPMGFYRDYTWWPGVTHFLTGTLVSVLVFSLLVYLGKISKNIYIPFYLIPLIVLLSIFPVGVSWEISEFFVDIFFNRRLQAGIQDTVLDIFCNFAGVALSLIIIYFLNGGWTLEERGKDYNPIDFIKGRADKFLKAVQLK